MRYVPEERTEEDFKRTMPIEKAPPDLQARILAAFPRSGADRRGADGGDQEGRLTKAAARPTTSSNIAVVSTPVFVL